MRQRFRDFGTSGGRERLCAPPEQVLDDSHDHNAGREEPVAERVSAKRLADRVLQHGNDDFARLVRSQGSRLLATQAATRAERAVYYRASVGAVSPGVTPICVSERAQAVVEMAVDPLAGIGPAELVGQVQKAESEVVRVLRSAESLYADDRAQLLLRRSALIRRDLRLRMPAEVLQLRRLNDAAGFADEAASLAPTGFAVLERAMVMLAQAKLTPAFDYDYVCRLREVDQLLSEAHHGFACPPALLGNIQFHRSCYAPLVVCRLFERLKRMTDDITTVYANASIYAEAALLLAHDAPGASEVRRHLDEADVG